MAETKNIERIGLRYICQSAVIIAVLCIATVATAYLAGIEGLKTPLIVSAVFSLIIDGADGMIWTKVVRKSPGSLTTFYTAVSGFRMLIALFTLFGVYLAVGRDSMTEYCIVLWCSTLYCWHTIRCSSHVFRFLTSSVTKKNNSIMKQLKSFILLAVLAVFPLFAMAGEAEEKVKG